VSNKSPPSIGEIEVALARENALTGNAATVLARYHRARTRLAYLRIAAADPATLMGGRLPGHEDKEMEALTPRELTKCLDEAMDYMTSLMPPK